jgi:hypothetical protein
MGREAKEEVPLCPLQNPNKPTGMASVSILVPATEHGYFVAS